MGCGAADGRPPDGGLKKPPQLGVSQVPCGVGAELH